MPKPTEPAARAAGAHHDAPALPRVEMNVAALSHPGLVRANNEDSYVVCRMGRYLERVDSNIPETELASHFEAAGHLMIVADGVGGHEGGEVASRTALVSALRHILRSPRWALRLDDPATREREIREMFERSQGYLARVHAEIHSQAESERRLRGMGTTLTGAYAIGTDLFVLHVGDSKAYLVRGGAMRKLTRDHTVAQEFADLGAIRQDEVANHRMGHVLTRAVGMPSPAVEGDTHHVAVRDGDRLLLCSDGLTDMAGEDRIAETLAAHAAPADACRALVELALAGGGRDNVTVVLADYRLQ